MSTRDVPARIGDLPAVGRPATSALLGIGVTTLAEVAQRSERELLALHGVGPRAVRILREALAERGEAFADDFPAAAPSSSRSTAEVSRANSRTVNVRRTAAGT